MAKKKTGKPTSRGKPTSGGNPYKRKKDRSRQLQRCPVCGAPIQRLHLDEMGFATKRYDDATYFWCCKNYPACNTYVKEDRRTGRPYGTLAGPALRHKRIVIHQFEVFLLKNGYYKTHQDYWGMVCFLLGGRTLNTVHAREMTEYQCDTVLDHITKNILMNNSYLFKCIFPGSAIAQYLHNKLGDAMPPIANVNNNPPKSAAAAAEAELEGEESDLLEEEAELVPEEVDDAAEGEDET